MLFPLMNQPPSDLRVSLKRSIKALGLRRLLTRALRRELFRAKIAGIYYLKQRPAKTHVFVLCTGRTGSNLLVSYLNSNPAAFFGGEILSPDVTGIRYKLISKSSIYRHVRHFLNYGQRPVSGAKICFAHLEIRGLSPKKLDAEFPEANWIVLYRKNVLDQFISYEMAYKTGQWARLKNSREPSTENTRIELSASDMLKYFELTRQRYESALKTPGIRKHSLWISYEELAENPQALFDEAIFPFLGLARNQVRTSLIKQNIWSYPEIISNYKEVQEFIEHSDFTQNYARYPGKNR